MTDKELEEAAVELEVLADISEEDGVLNVTEGLAAIADAEASAG